MKIYSNEEIISAVQSIFDAYDKTHFCIGWEPEGCISIGQNTPEKIEVQIKCMYEAPSPNLEVLMKMAEFFGTKNINDDDHFANGGCETCDYGSSYGYTLTIRPEK